MNGILKKITALTVSAVLVTGSALCTAVTVSAAETDSAASGSTADYVVIDGGSYSKDMKTLISVAPETSGTFTIEPTVTEIKSTAFSGCSLLEEIVIPQGVTKLGGNHYGTNIFSDCTSLVKFKVDERNTAYTSEDGVLYNKDKTCVVLAPTAFYGSLKLPSSVRIIDSYAFCGCKKLKDIVIPDGAHTICKSAFYGCNYLQTVVIPDSVKNFEDNVFYNCYKGILIIYSNPGSAAEKYAKDNSITWRDASIPFDVDVTFSSKEYTQGMAVRFSIKAKGGTGNYSYNIHYKKPGDDKLYMPAASTFVAETTGEYKIVFWAKCNTTYLEREIPIIVKPAAGLTNKSTVSSKGIGLGQSIDLHAEGVGGKGEHYYAIMYKKSGTDKWTQLTNKYSMKSDAALTPSQAGVYDIMINVKDETGTVKSKKFKLTVSPYPLENKSTVSAQTVPAETKVILTAAATGGTSKYTYAIMYKKHRSSSWIQLVPKYGTQSTASLTPAKAGVYDIMINVKDSTGTIASKKFTLNATDPLVNTSSVSASTVSPGKIISAFAGATGGTGSYTYAIMYKKFGDEKWTQLVPKYGTMSTAGFTLKAVGSYKLMINVKDSSGKIKSKTFTVKVA